MIKPVAYEVELQLFPDRGTLIYTNEEFLNMPNRATLLEKGAAVPLYAIPDNHVIIDIALIKNVIHRFDRQFKDVDYQGADNKLIVAIEELEKTLKAGGVK